MKRFDPITLIAAVALAGLATASSYVNADNSASSYTRDGTAVVGAAAQLAGVVDADGYTKVLASELSNSGTPKDLVIGLSFETSLFTMTMVQSKGGNKSTSTADAKIEMYVLVDGKMAEPGIVTFDRRRQELWASLGGVLNCIDTNLDNIINYDECALTEEEIGLILETSAAHTFNFLANNIGSGGHTIEAYARLSKDGNVEGLGASDASASLGKGTLSVWEVQDSVTH